jgi:hypothetical protein
MWRFLDEISVFYPSCQYALALGMVVVAVAGNEDHSFHDTIEPPGG